MRPREVRPAEPWSFSFLVLLLEQFGNFAYQLLTGCWGGARRGLGTARNLALEEVAHGLIRPRPRATIRQHFQVLVTNLYGLHSLADELLLKFFQCGIRRTGIRRDVVSGLFLVGSAVAAAVASCR